jgi:putative tryptophan/tyrosine transport system substrate-binding protein
MGFCRYDLPPTASGANVRRREFVRLLAGSAVAGPCAVFAQQSSRVYRLGSLNTAAPLNEANPNGKILLAALAQRGYVLGRNLSYDARGAMGDPAKVRQHMAEFKEANVDVVVAVGYPVAVAAKALQIPTVIAWGGGDPVATGLIDGLARPGGNITGDLTWQPR